MIPRPHVDWFALAPELMLLGAMGFALMGAVLLPKENRRDFGALSAAIGFTGAFVYAVVIYVHTPEPQSVIRLLAVTRKHMPAPAAARRA